MMAIALMKRFFDTVDPNGQSPIADQIAARWLEGAAKVRCIRASANFAFHVETGDRSYVLRFNHASERAPEYIAAELEYIERLAADGIQVARPILSLSGRAIESVPTAVGVFHGVLFEALSGDSLELNNLSVEGLERWGRALGEVHNTSEGLEIAGRPDWGDHLAMARRIIPCNEAAAWAEMNEVEARLHKLPVGKANFGLIHYDFELDNMVWHGGRARIYDCDDCARYWFAADVVHALRELFDDRAERIDVGDVRFQSFLRGYRSVRRMEDGELRHAPVFARMHNLVAFAHVYRSIADGPLPNEPQWTSDLRAKLIGKLNRYRESFREHTLRHS